ncbi:MAG TPA: asparagine synthase (glutamine-hydrolyzing), partial [Verrucomicrobiae bacterium]|nr:asparagine synthase (glutamine-hydrolyzing) [Verrucomicrobiae bacterium]
AGAVGCRRLAIIDVAGGAQPLANETGDVIAVCNGEIYNSAPLRSALQSRGHRFRTHSDAEVLPHLYEDEGIDFVHALDGMFGLALWDARRGRLVLARDRMGEKPLYHATTPAGFLFASEPKALLASGQVGREPDWAALAAYLRTGYVPNPASAFAAIGKLPPGGRLVLEGESARADRYWELAPFLAAPPLELGLDDAATALRAHLVRAVRAALVSDVPLGVFLSGGLDSTAVTAVTRSIGGELNTFALGFAERGFDERDHAALAARALGTRHHTLTITPSLFLEGVRDLVPLIDEPLADPAWVPTFLLARFARTHVKTVLVGEGADELFAGYPTYLGGALAARYARLPAGVRRVVAALAPALGAPQGNTTVRYLLRRFLEEAERPAAARHRAWTGCVDTARLAALATPGGPLTAPPEPAGLPARSAIDALLALDLTGYLTDDLLPKLDRASMAASLEGRAPFLDHRLVEFACRLPVALKVRGLATKRVLRRAVADLVPTPIRRRVKRGLTVPLAAWLAGPLLPFARTTLERLDPRVIRPEAVRALLDEHVARHRDNRRELWALIVLQLWREGAGVA